MQCCTFKYFLASFLVFAIAIPLLIAEGPTTPFTLPDPRQVVSFLSQTVTWHAHLSAEQQMASDLSELSYVEDNRQMANEIAHLSFEFARVDSELQAKQQPTVSAGAAEDPAAASYQRMVDLAAKADARVKQSQAELDRLRQKLEAAAPDKRAEMQSAMAEVQSELELAETRREVLRNMVSFSGVKSTSGAGGFRAQIEELAKALPAAASSDTESVPKRAGAAERTAGTVPVSTSVHKAEPTGIIGLISELFSLFSKGKALDQSIQMTDALADTSKNLRTPFSTDLRNAIRRGDEISNQPDSADPKVLAQQKQELDVLTEQFKREAAVALPLMKQRVLLDQYSRNLKSWRSAVRSRYLSDWRSLGVRLAVLAVLLALLITASRLWTWAILRYVSELRRRYQYLLIRRIAFWFALATILIVTFASEMGSLATFAGLLTAGLALALQNVIVSMVGYFILIGQYGVRVGDRLNISGVTGEVVEIGLTRLHVMELGDSGDSYQPTGRVVSFSNSVVFQPRGIFKQIPGTSFVWHEISLTMTAESDYRAAEERICGAVDKVFSEYRDQMETQRRRMAKTLTSVEVPALGPQSRLRLTQHGLEIVVRYPLELKNAAHIDDRMTREVLDAVDREPRLQRVGGEMPKVQPAEAE